jgi:hypothetical protein
LLATKNNENQNTFKAMEVLSDNGGVNILCNQPVSMNGTENCVHGNKERQKDKPDPGVVLIPVCRGIKTKSHKANEHSIEENAPQLSPELVVTIQTELK